MNTTTIGSLSRFSRRLQAPIAILASLSIVVLLWLASGLPIPAELNQFSSQLQGVVTIFLGIFLEALPFLLAGVLASSAIELFVTPAQLARLTPRNPLLAALAGAFLGLLFPVCECGSVPTARRLMQKGVPVPLGIAFMLAAPVINPIVIASTWVAFGHRPEIVLGRIILTLLIAVITGVVIGLHPQPQQLLADPTTDHGEHVHDHHHDHNHEHDHGQEPSQNKLRSLLGHASIEFFEMGRYLVIGGLIAATLQVIIPRTLLLALGQGPVVSIIALMALAVILSICSTVDAFVALAFAQSFLPGALLAFLVFGPMVDVKSVLMFGTAFRRRTVLWMVILPAQLVLLAGVVINIYVT
jgi:uncharacterized protein